MTRVEVRDGNVDGALKRWKVKVAKSGVPSELKKHKELIKKSPTYKQLYNSEKARS